MVKGAHRVHSTGEKLPKQYSIHRATVVNILSDVGAFVQLGDGKTYKDGLLHIASINMHPDRHKGLERLERVEDVLSLGAKVWVKVNEVKEGEGKYGLDMRWVHQSDGTDLNPMNNNVKNREPPDNGFFGSRDKHWSQQYTGSTATRGHIPGVRPENMEAVQALQDQGDDGENSDEEKVERAQVRANKLSIKAEKRLKKVKKLKKKAKKLKKMIKGKKTEAVLKMINGKKTEETESSVSSDVSSDSGSV